MLAFLATRNLRRYITLAQYVRPVSADADAPTEEEILAGRDWDNAQETICGHIWSCINGNLQVKVEPEWLAMSAYNMWTKLETRGIQKRPSN